MNKKQLIPPITSYMISKQPDQTADILNRLIRVVNELNNK